MNTKKYSPMIEHYLSMKEKNPEALLFYRLGDFYEMFFEDAKTASSELDLVLTARAAGNGIKVPMCGIPYHSVQSYIQRLVKKGYKIAICEQLSDPAASKGLVDRDIIKIITPGTYMDEGLEAKSYNYMAALNINGWKACLILCELSTGQLKVMNLAKSVIEVQKKLLEYNVCELVILKSLDKKWQQFFNENSIVLSYGQKGKSTEQIDELLKSSDSLSKETLGLLLNYLEATQMQSIDYFMPAENLDENKNLYLDYETRMHLELTRTNSQALKAETLFSFMDRTRSAIGSRKLKNWIENPLVDLKEIIKRQEAVEKLSDDFILEQELDEELSYIYDLERLSSRIAYGNASIKDVQQLIVSLQHAKYILENAQSLASYPEFQNVDPCQDLYEEIKDAFVEEPPLTFKDGGVFKEGYSKELDEVRNIAQKGKDYILEFEASEKQKTGIKSLKVGYTRAFGYYIEVRNGSLGLIKEEYGYKSRQTLVNATRYITDELKAKEEEILSAQQRKIDLELSLFKDLLNTIKKRIYDLHALAEALSTIDALHSLSKLAYQEGYVRPDFNKNHQVNVLEGKHPILDHRLDHYISNDWIMDENTTAQLITGPNMGGKSTYMRQNALLVIMAQMGSFIPAKKASLPIFDRIFTRIGASDDLLSGQSTFMKEMLEANQALQFATKDSLILFDEIGRGTATYDGMALAQSMLEFIETAIGAKTLFSTHYHELTDLQEHLGTIQNIHVEVNEHKDTIEFKYRMIPGKSDRSYGINVAKIAGLPSSVLDRAEELLKTFESSANEERYQPSLFVMENVVPQKRQVLDLLNEIDMDTMSPRQAWECLEQLKKLQEEIDG